MNAFTFKLLQHFSITLFLIAQVTYANENCRLPEEFKNIQELAKNSMDIARSFQIKRIEDQLDFEFNPKVLVANGEVLYSSYFGDGEMSDEMEAVLEKLKVNESPEFKAVKAAKKVHFFSLSKTSYFIPHAKAEYFTNELTGSEEYINQTLKDVTKLPAENGGIRTKKSIPVFADAVIEMKSETKYKDGFRKTSSQLVGTDKNTTFMDYAYSESHYQDIPGKGVIVTTYNVGTMSKNIMGWFKTKAVQAAHGLGKDISNFETETMYTVEKNAEYKFSKK